tara:strand:- start:52 stop:204 length:153 start_codon:yes stop_codon:yes gene_type:complete
MKQGKHKESPGLGYILAKMVSGSGAEKSVCSTLSPFGDHDPISKGLPSVK